MKSIFKNPGQFWEDGEVGNTKIFPPPLDDNGTGRICLMELFRNSVKFTESAPRPQED